MRRFSRLLIGVPAVLAVFAVAFPISAQDTGSVDETPQPVATVAHAGRQGPVLRFPFTPELEPVGSYSFSVLVGDSWQRVGAIEADAHMRPGTIDLTPWATGSTITLRIGRAGGGMAHVDAFMINGQPPVIDDDRLSRKLGKLDYDVLDDSEVVGDWTFETVPDSPALLEFTGRIEPIEPSETPFLYPLSNMYGAIGIESEFYTYTLGSNLGRLVVDGDVADEEMGQPFFEEWFRVGTGHPQGSTRGWVRDDGQSLYVAIDFTSDNSMDGGKDFASVFVKTLSGVREYKVSTLETDWGLSAFGYTGRVPWEHKTYEFEIPLSEFLGGPR